MASSDPAATHLGFLTVVNETNGYLGGYLVTNLWGRPLEFRLSTAVQPNRVQQILYAGTLQPFICGDLIGKTLVEKTATAAGLIITDCAAALDLRHGVEVPVAWLAGPQDAAAAALGSAGLAARPAEGERGPLLCHPRYPGDVDFVRSILDKAEGLMDPAEPFQRIRDAMAEARKMGLTKAA